MLGGPLDRSGFPSPSGDADRRSVVYFCSAVLTLRLAGDHGVAPLLFGHLKDHGEGLPVHVLRQLRALYFRHRRSNEVRLTVLSDILEAFGGAGIEPTVLKGPALIALVYRDPGLRPFMDLDILVPQHDAVRAQRTLGDMGFTAAIPSSRYHLTRDHHLRPAVRVVDGVLVQVEIHRDLFQVASRASFQVTARAPGAIPFDVAGQVGYGLGPDEMVWHLCRHLRWFRLIGIADVLGWTEHFVEEIDWVRVARRYPFVINALTLIHSLTPLSEVVRLRSGVTVVPVHRGMVEAYGGWPRGGGFVWDGVCGRLRFLRSLMPCEWWLRFYYETRPGRIGLWYARLRHWARLVQLAIRRLADLVPRRHRPPR